MFCAYVAWRRRPWISAWLSIVASSSSRDDDDPVPDARIDDPLAVQLSPRRAGR